MTESFSFCDDPLEPAPDQGGDIREDAWKKQTSRGSEVPRLPLGIELLLELPQPLKVVEMFPVMKDKCPDPVPERSERTVLHSGERRHSQAEAPIPFLLAPQHQLD